MENILTQKISGVYKIENTANKKHYIGSTHNISYRWNQHTNLLANNKHYVREMQADWNIFGGSVFIFSTIEVCDKEALLVREKYYINTFSPEYNKHWTGRHFPESPSVVANKIKNMTAEMRNRISAKILGRKSSQEDRLKMVNAKHIQYYGHPMPPDMIEAWFEREQK